MFKRYWVYFSIFCPIMNQMNNWSQTSCRRYGNLEGLKGSKKLEGLVSPESAGGVEGSRFWVLGGSTRSNFEKNVRENMVDSYQIGELSFFCKGFFQDLSWKWAIHSRIGTALTISTTLIKFAGPIWSTPASWKW